MDAKTRTLAIVLNLNKDKLAQTGEGAGTRKYSGGCFRFLFNFLNVFGVQLLIFLFFSTSLSSFVYLLRVLFRLPGGFDLNATKISGEHQRFRFYKLFQCSRVLDVKYSSWNLKSDYTLKNNETY